MNELNYFKSSLFTSLQCPVFNDGENDLTPRFRDIHFVISNKSLEALDPASLSKFLEPLTQPSSSDSLSLSDDDLASIVQSRYVQQPSDVQNFANFLKEAADNLTANIKDYSERQKRWSEFKSSLNKTNAFSSSDPSTGSSSVSTVSDT